MNKKYLNQDEFNAGIYQACKSGDSSVATNLLYKHYLKQQKSKINSFLSICGLGYPVLSLNCSIAESFSKACADGHKDVVNVFLNNEFILKESHKSHMLLYGITTALKAEQLEIIDLILPYVESKNQEYYNALISGLLDACEHNKLNSVKYIFNNKELKFDIYHAFYPDLEIDERGDIPSRCISRAIYNNHTDILSYFAFELSGFHKNHFLKTLHDLEVNLNNLQKLEVYQELTKEINTSNNTSKKRLKI
jgi:hypothetical protein